MAHILKHILSILLAALVVYGSVGMHVYVYTCHQHNHSAKWSFDGHQHCVCELRGDTKSACCSTVIEPQGQPIHDGFAIEQADCCTMDSQELVLDEFGVSQEQTAQLWFYHLLSFVLPTYSLQCTGCHATANAVAYSYPLPTEKTALIYQHGQLRL